MTTYYLNRQQGNVTAGDTIVCYTHETPIFGVYVVDASTGNPINLAGRSVEFLVMSAKGTTQFKYTTVGGGITIGGSSNNLLTITGAAADLTNTGAGAYQYTTWDLSNNKVLGTGTLEIRQANQT